MAKPKRRILHQIRVDVVVPQSLPDSDRDLFRLSVWDKAMRALYQQRPRGVSSICPPMPGGIRGTVRYYKNIPIRLLVQWAQTGRHAGSYIGRADLCWEAGS